MSFRKQKSIESVDWQTGFVPQNWHNYESAAHNKTKIGATVTRKMPNNLSGHKECKKKWKLDDANRKSKCRKSDLKLTGLTTPKWVRIFLFIFANRLYQCFYANKWNKVTTQPSARRLHNGEFRNILRFSARANRCRHARFQMRAKHIVSMKFRSSASLIVRGLCVFCFRLFSSLCRL